MAESGAQGIRWPVDAAQQVLRDILRLPGALYCALVDQLTGEVVTDVAEKSPLTTEVVEWAAAVAVSVGGSSAHELDDIMVTSRDAHHLVRRIAPAGCGPVLVVLALDRATSNLAVARRELAASGLSGVLSAAVPLSAPELPAPELPSPELPSPVLPAPALPAVLPTTSRLPRRSSSSRGPRRWPLPPAPRHPEPSASPVLRQHWADDVPTMRRLLVGLRSLL